MATIYLLDSGPFALLAHDRAVRRAAIQTWLLQEMSAGATVFMSEVADYEVRRELAAASDKPLTDVRGSDTAVSVQPNKLRREVPWLSEPHTLVSGAAAGDKPLVQRPTINRTELSTFRKAAFAT
jgi:hypothetical protein